jgi:thioredoxin 1
MNGSFDPSRRVNPGHYEITITEEEARLGTKKILPTKNIRLEANIPAGVRTGSTVKLTNARQLIDGHPGDVLIQIKVKEEEMAAWVIEINDGNFEDEVLKCSSPVMVDFWGFGCVPCQMIAPITEKLAKEYAGRLKFCKLNVDENPQMASKYQIMSIPQILFFKGGKVIEQSVGAVPEPVLRSKSESVLGQNKLAY